MIDRVDAGRASPPLPAPSKPPNTLARWRAAFIVYLLALTTGTHWPNLRIDTEVPNSDKVVHFLAFGGLAYLLWRTRWIRSPWLVGCIAVPWAALDEWAQGLPGVHRTVSFMDFLAGALGVITATLWIAFRNRNRP